MGRRSRQAVGEEEEEDGESQVVPSFRSAFNEALLSASVSVIAAQSGESPYLMVKSVPFSLHCFFTASGGKPGSRTAKKGRKKLVLFSTGGMRGVN